MCGNTVENLGAEFRVGHLSPSELQRHLHLVPVVEEVDDVTNLGVEVALSDLGTELHLLDGDVGCLLPRLFGSL